MGALALVAGAPKRLRSEIDVTVLAREVSTEADHVTAVELGRWIRDRKANLRIIDIRDSASFEDYHIPLAERVSLERLVGTDIGDNETIVLYSGGGAHAAQGWVFLRAQGHANVFFLRGGVNEWIGEVMNPQLPRNAPASERAELDSVAALSRYFGGVPRTVDSIDVVPERGDGARERRTSWRSSTARLRGRGC